MCPYITWSPILHNSVEMPEGEVLNGKTTSILYCVIVCRLRNAVQVPVVTSAEDFPDALSIAKTYVQHPAKLDEIGQRKAALSRV